MIWRDIKEERKEKQDKNTKTKQMKKKLIEESLILYKPINNQVGEYKEHICILCTEKIGSNLDICACPECSTVFHMKHLSDWAEIYEECPMCHFRLKK
ncbi:MAG: E3 ubiquitin protein ligase [Asgard group archaeon]|nr:E3 ubiquitin protein ligase [Asgard group archaeon]